MTSEESAIKLIAGFALRTPPTVQKDREEVDKNDNWACPACADISVQEKQRRSSESFDKGLNKVTWRPTWEPVQEETENKHPAFLKHILNFGARKDAILQ